jgi:hypothetical protein
MTRITFSTWGLDMSIYAFVTRSFFVGAVVVLGACTRTVPVEPTPEPPPGPQVCTDDTDCPAGQNYVCLGVCRRLCNGADALCGPAEFCDGLYCEVGCRDSTTCESGKLCVDGACTVAAQECTGRCDCSRGQVCADGVCQSAGTTCSTSADCPRGPEATGAEMDRCEIYECDGFSDVCFTTATLTCVTEEDCVGRPGCIGQQCVCTQNGDCAPDAACTAATEGTACGAGFYCNSDFRCAALTNCSASETCPPELTCAPTGQCERPRACTTATDCQSAGIASFCAGNGFCALPTCINGGRMCTAPDTCNDTGNCVPPGAGDPCQGDGQCQSTQYCNLSASPSVCAVGCRNNSGCGQNQVCNDNHQCGTQGGGGGGLGAACPNGDADCVAGFACGLLTATCVEKCTVSNTNDVDCPVCSAANGSCECRTLLIIGDICRPN